MAAEVPIKTNKIKLENKSLKRRLEIIKNISLLLLIASVLSLLSSLFQLIIAGGGFLSVGFATLSFCIGIPFAFSFWLAQAKDKATPRRADIAALVLTVSLLVAIALAQFLEIGTGAMMASYFIIPVLAGVCGLARRFILFIVISNGFLMTVTYNLKILGIGSSTPAEGFQIYTLQILVNWLVIYAIIAGGIITFTSRLAKSTTVAEQQAERLGELLLALNSSVEFSTKMAYELANVTTELNSTWQNYSSSTQEQVAAVSQVAAGLEELNETANSIASSATSAANSAGQALSIASEVKESSEMVQSAVIEGTQSVDQVVTSVAQVRNRIEMLGQKLLNLTEQTRRVGTIIDLIDEIADETHLLALNASIEAAGNIQQTAVAVRGENIRRGERFGVIAQEIKNLSDRSRESTEEVRGAISEMQGAVAAAVLVAEEGKKETAAALARCKISGAVIDKLNEVIASSAAQAYIIVKAAEGVNNRCDEISIATQQQRNANQQAVMTMRDITKGSQDSAKVVQMLFQSISRVNDQIAELSHVLNKSHQIVSQGIIEAV